MTKYTLELHSDGLLLQDPHNAVYQVQLLFTVRGISLSHLQL